MLQALDPPVQTLDDFVRQVIPPNILSSRSLFEGRSVDAGPSGPRPLSEPLTESEVLRLGIAKAGKLFTGSSFIGGGYYGTLTPQVIKRNVLENPAWYTSYTPYQPEISQGRLESLLNFQTLVSDLTALPIANASLLDEGTAAAEAMTLSMNALPVARAKRPGKTFLVSDRMFPQTIQVLNSRAEGFGITVKAVDLSSETGTALDEIKALGDDLVGVMVQYPDSLGIATDFRAIADATHAQGALFSVATDLMALTLLTPPGEFGADVAFGSAQRLGVPMGFGGPHAAFFAVTDKHRRRIPGRLVGVTRDRLGRRALRLALQTREQHIRREKATSNVCTAQALLANMASLYAVYHGPDGMRKIAERIVRGARVVRDVAAACGFETVGSPERSFDTVVVELGDKAAKLAANAKDMDVYVRWMPGNRIGISVDEATTKEDLEKLETLFRRVSGRETGDGEGLVDKALKAHAGPLEWPEQFRRTSKYLQHPIFNSYHSETEMVRYIYHLQSKDLSLVHSMIPLGSCTMKLNGTTEMALIGLPGVSELHPYMPDHSSGIQFVIDYLGEQLKDITAMDAVSLQPNSGAQGEFAGLRTIRQYHENTDRSRKRDICLIPVSAHGTNPASAAMAGMRVVPIKCDTKTGNLDMADLEAKCREHEDKLAAIMITYPSTYGVFESNIKEVCDMVHRHGGQVYMDGANMNAQIGLCSPGEIGADVCHLNLHKTFCIPHGGGGPGVGPICVKAHLAPYLPTTNFASLGVNSTKTAATSGPETVAPVSSAPHGSASILPISWAYNTLMGAQGLVQATKVTLLNANYLLSRLRPHYNILYTNAHGRCAHEFILDVRPFSHSAGIEAIDIAKRLQDYGFHAPTMSWPVGGTLMIEPTESESRAELDRFVEALVSIREEIREIEEGRQPRKGNVLKMAPHPLRDLIDGDGDGNKWDRPYSREKAAFPLPWLREKKFWPSVARVDDGKCSSALTSSWHPFVTATSYMLT